MYTHWQASWRGGMGLGAIVLVAVFSLAGPIVAESAIQRALFALAIVLGMCIYTLAVIVSFRFGLCLSGKPRVGLSVVILMPMLYGCALAAIAFVRFQTHAQAIDVVTGRDALIHNVVVPGIVFLVTFLLLPAAIACGTARMIEGRRSPNTSLERTREG